MSVENAYWLHVNHPNDKAMLHVSDGCAWARKAAARVSAGEPYGDVRGERNGYWEPHASLTQAEAAQTATGKAIQARCSRCFG